MNKKLRIIYAGTPDFSVPALQALIDSQYDVVAVYTQPDRRSGRGRKLHLGPVKKLALQYDIPVEQPLSLKDEETQQILSDYQADIIVVAAYSLMLPPRVLDIPTYGCLNIHASLLPRWRGAAPIQRAIQACDSHTGVTIMQMAAGLDTGDMLHKITRPILASDGGQSIHDQLSLDGAMGLMTVIEQLVNDELQAEKQDDSLSTYAHKLNKAEGEIDWNQPAIEIDALIRAFDAWPTAYTLYKGKQLKYLASSVVDYTGDAAVGSVITESKLGIDIVTGKGAIRISCLQMSGGKKLAVQDFINARSLLGEVFPS
jgi:methionyl-tRNA formyltransferase